MKNVYRSMIASVLVVASVYLAFSQGSLTPPGPPTATMKTLDQIEARIPLSKPKAPATYPIVINQPGSYYLTENLFSTGSATAIQITVSFVVLDLNGFTLSGNNQTTGTQIGIEATHGAVVRNGAVAVFASHGIKLASNSTVEDVYVSGCGEDGIAVGSNSIVRNSRVENCGWNGVIVSLASIVDRVLVVGNGRDGILHFGNGSVTQVTARSNTGVGIRAGLSTISNSTAAFNTDVGMVAGTINNSVAQSNGSVGFQVTGVVEGCSAKDNAADGIQIQGGGTVIKCVATSNGTGGSGSGIVGMVEGNQIVECSAQYNRTNGIQVPIGSSVTGCTVRNNGGDGILAANDSLLRRNTSTANRGAGIHTTSAGNRIEDNQVVFNTGAGIRVEAAFSLVLRNSCRFNTPNYQIAANNNVGPIVVPPPSGAINGNSGGGGVGSTDPSANIAY